MHNDDDEKQKQKSSCNCSSDTDSNRRQDIPVTTWEERQRRDPLFFIKVFKHRVNIDREWTDLSTRRAQDCLFIVNTFNRDWNRCWSLRSILILSLTIVASTVTGVKAGDDETLSRSNSWALILFKPAEVQSRRIWVTVTVQSHWISLLYFSRRTDGHRGILRGI